MSIDYTRMFIGLQPTSRFSSIREFKAEFSRLRELPVAELRARVHAKGLAINKRDARTANRLAYLLCGGRKLKLACHKEASGAPSPHWLRGPPQQPTWSLLPPLEAARDHALRVCGSSEAVDAYLRDMGSAPCLAVASVLLPSVDALQGHAHVADAENVH